MTFDGNIVSKWIVRLLLLIGGVLLLIGIYNYFSDRSEIYKNRSFTTGVIIDYGHVGRGGYSVEYEYYVNDSLYVGVHTVDKISSENCIGLEFRVIYSNKNPEKSFLLATKRVFDIFDLEIPEKIKPIE